MIITYEEIAADLANQMRLSMQKPIRRGGYTTNAIASGETYRKTVGKVIRSARKTNILIVSSDYWQYSNYGRRSGGMPPVAAIERWIKYKRLRLNAWAVAKSIAKKGTNKPPALWADRVSIDETIRQIAEKRGTEIGLMVVDNLRKIKL